MEQIKTITSMESKIDLFKKVIKSVCPDFKVTDQNRQILNNLFSYCVGEDGEYDTNKGIWLCGSIGTGKSTLMKIISRFDLALNPPHSVCENNVWKTVSGGFMIHNCTNVATFFSSNGIDGLDAYTYNNSNPKTIGFDELGREPKLVKSFGTELNVMQYIFQVRYELREVCKTHVTTNMHPDGMNKFYDYYIADRAKEMFNVIELNGKSLRR